MAMISVGGGVGVLFEGGELDDGFEDGFQTTFARRYLPDVLRGDARPNVIIERFKGEKFRVFSSLYDVNSKDYYKLESAVPQAYKNEAPPVFFLLQATARAGARKGRIFITDSVSVINENGKAVLFVGYPHTGKSTISALALSEGLPVLSTENTVVDVRDGRIFVIGGHRRPGIRPEDRGDLRDKGGIPGHHEERVQDRRHIELREEDCP